jgi:hypothetical protein
MKFKILLALAALLGMSPLAANAASIALSLQYVGSTKADYTTPAGYSLANPITPGQVLPSDVHQFAIYFKVNGLTGTQALQYLAVDVNLGAGLTPETGGGAYPAYGGNLLDIIDPPGPPPAAPLFQFNAETGNPFDLKEITGITNQAQAVAAKPGDAAPYKLGDFYVNYTGNATTTINLVKRPGDTWFYYPATTGAAIDAGSDITGASFTITAVPEPSTLALAAAGLSLGLVGLRRSRRMAK